GLADPRLLEGRRGDDGGRARGRRDRERGTKPQSLGRRADDDRRDRLARDRLGSGPGLGLRVRFPVLRRAATVRVHVPAQRGLGAVRAPREEQVLMSLVAEADTRTAVNLALRGRKRQVGGMLFRFGLLATLLLALAILLILLVSTLIEAWPVLSTRGWEFVTSDSSSLPERAGVWQGLVGSLILVGFVAAIALPIGIAAAIYLQEYTRDTRTSRILIANIRNLAGVPAVVYGILG